MLRSTLNFLGPFFIAHRKFNAIGIDFNDGSAGDSVSGRNNPVANNSRRIILTVNYTFNNQGLVVPSPEVEAPKIIGFLRLAGIGCGSSQLILLLETGATATVALFKGVTEVPGDFLTAFTTTRSKTIAKTGKSRSIFFCLSNGTPCFKVRSLALTFSMIFSKGESLSCVFPNSPAARGHGVDFFTFPPRNMASWISMTFGF